MAGILLSFDLKKSLIARVEKKEKHSVLKAISRAMAVIHGFSSVDGGLPSFASTLFIVGGVLVSNFCLWF
jgi:hypothetical protein